MFHIIGLSKEYVIWTCGDLLSNILPGYTWLYNQIPNRAPVFILLELLTETKAGHRGLNHSCVCGFLVSVLT
ncbi:hypothetical protein ACHAW6_011629 [Cyclotella cf. meneghiniana]